MSITHPEKIGKNYAVLKLYREQTNIWKEKKILRWGRKKKTSLYGMGILGT